MVVCEAVVKNKYGIHCRPSGLIAKAAQAYSGEIRVQGRNGQEGEARSVLALMGLGIQCGDRIRIFVEGPDEEAVGAEFVEHFERVYDFQR